MTSDSDVLIGVDVGSTTVAGGLVTRQGEVLSALEAGTKLGSGTVVATILDIVTALVGEASRRALSVEAVGVGVPGLVDRERGAMVASAGSILADLQGISLVERVAAKTGLPTFVDNDVNALALGEWTFGAGRGAASCVVIAIGTAVGAGIIVDGQLVRGAGGYAGELGHVSIDFDGPPCRCGGRGCLSLYLGGDLLAAEARRRIVREPSNMLALARGDLAAITAETVFAAAAQRDGLAGAMVERACRALGAGLALVVNGLNPEVIVVTGGVVKSLLPLRAEIARRTQEYALAEVLAGTAIHLIPGEKRQTVRGGAALVLHELARGAAGRRDTMVAPAVKTAGDRR
ncbi:MAG TPA: ROK family protein [Methylomirabilota bacterium]|nr:ROK family protein [Methylomirabilota bacterium]